LASYLIDGHIATLLLTPSLHPLLEILSNHIQKESRYLNMLETRIKGPMSIFNVPESAVKMKKGSVDREKAVGKALRKRWKRMVHDVQDGVGKYAIEVFEL
jgi:hypothetical protein